MKRIDRTLRIEQRAAEMKACAEACARDRLAKCRCALSRLPKAMEEEAMRLSWEMW